MMAGILAVFAEFERNVISQRTRDGLAEKRAEGVVLGRRRAIDDDLLTAIIGMYQLEGNYSRVARMLNEAHVPTPGGGVQWFPASVQRVLSSVDARQMAEQLQDAVA